ncbi:MAG: hypothetical protein Q8K82_25030 [Gemmatimonadaceae bacterium]|nr:hypothetical protein [Gemmatimonadaceae bacterium]
MYTQIHAWLNRTHPLPRRFAASRAADALDAHWLAWVGLNERHQLHEAASLDWYTLQQSAERARRYVDEAVAILGSDQVEEVGDKAAVLAALGNPPSQATPLYIITTCDGGSEEPVYIGKTTSKSRFAGGHRAALRLLAPRFKSADKFLYRCSITVSLDADHVALEWVDPLATACAILDDVESRLIHSLQPSLNTHKRKADVARNKCAIHVQNTIEGTLGSFLDDYIVDQAVD